VDGPRVDCAYASSVVGDVVIVQAEDLDTIGTRVQPCTIVFLVHAYRQPRPPASAVVQIRRKLGAPPKVKGLTSFQRVSTISVVRNPPDPPICVHVISGASHHRFRAFLTFLGRAAGPGRFVKGMSNDVPSRYC